MREVTKLVVPMAAVDTVRAALPGVEVDGRYGPGVLAETALTVVDESAVGRTFRSTLTGEAARLVSYNLATVLLEPAGISPITKFTVARAEFVCGWDLAGEPAL